MQAEPLASDWPANLTLGLNRRADRTVLEERSHLGPLRVQRPFYPEGPEVCHLYILHPPGGVVSGDRLTVEVKAGADTHTLATTPGATKFYRHDGQRLASQQQLLRVGEGACLEWLPQETILFNGAAADLLTRVELAPGGRFLGWEMLSLGRPASGETLEQCQVRQRFEIWSGDRPVWLERSRYRSSDPALDAQWGLQGFPLTATLVCTVNEAGLADRVRDQLGQGDNELLGITQLDEVLVCRYLGHYAQRARQRLAQAWSLLRPVVAGRPVVPPRIWNT